ncbi:MAG: biotin--[acetyl-CoA-carboxylase] ligase [Candidatus Caldarchaeum sp.]|nr:biotin--[acetyl-CoA-carboxylase] ligase [Candidatus Caldarchaeum sp.]
MRIRVVLLGDVGSTMDEARRLGAVEEGTVVVARSQSAGLGRMGRKWYSPVGGLWFTLVLYPRTSVQLSPLLTLMSTVAVSRGIASVSGLHPTIRWPNDVYLNGRKVAGILTEVHAIGDTAERALVGVGVNANFGLEQLPPDVRDNATTLLHETGSEVNIDHLLNSILSELGRLYQLFKTGRMVEIVREARTEADLFGKHVRVTLLNGSMLTGVFEELDDSGNAVLKTGHDKVRITPERVWRVEVL